METKRPSRIVIKGIEWTPALVKERINTSDQVLKNALLRLYTFQTEEEKQHSDTHESNGLGFNGTDAHILSEFAKQLLSKGWLSPKQIAIARKKLPKYSRQIFNYIADSRQEVANRFGI